MDNIADKLKAMLDNPEVLNTLSALMNNMPGSAEDISDIPNDTPTALSAGADSAEAISKIQKLMENVTPANDPRINLLNSLKPYMRKNRSAKMDQAIKLIQLSKMANLFNKL